MRREVDGHAFWLAVPSHGRAGRVATQQRLVGPCTWYVQPGQVHAYRTAGAAAVRVVDQPWPAARNVALADAAGRDLPLVQCDDDLGWVKLWDGERATAVPAPQAMARLVAALDGAALVGCAPTTNTRFARDGGMRRNLFCRSGLTAQDASAAWRAGVRYDLVLPLKEDYDLCLQHLVTFGGWLRDDGVLCAFAQRSARGGCADVRTPARERQAVRYLLAKWPGLVDVHPRRGDTEVMLRVPRPKAAA